MKTWNDIFFASCRRGDDPCYAIFLADEYIKRKKNAMNKDETALSHDNARRRAELAEAQADAAALRRAIECMWRDAQQLLKTDHPGTALLAELAAARAVVEAAREIRNADAMQCGLFDALAAYDKEQNHDL